MSLDQTLYGELVNVYECINLDEFYKVVAGVVTTQYGTWVYFIDVW